MDDDVVKTFDTVDELVEYIKDGQSGYNAKPASYYWHENPNLQIMEALVHYHLI